jgi:adenine-specific DNA glycosylase
LLQQTQVDRVMPRYLAWLERTKVVCVLSGGNLDFARLRWN